MLEILLRVMARPQDRLVQLVQLLQRQCIEFVEDRLVYWVHLQRRELEVFVSEQAPLDYLLSLLVAGPHVYHVLLVVPRVLQPLVGVLYHCT